jgi:hypothetical protein
MRALLNFGTRLNSSRYQIFSISVKTAPVKKKLSTSLFFFVLNYESESLCGICHFLLTSVKTSVVDPDQSENRIRISIKVKRLKMEPRGAIDGQNRAVGARGAVEGL